MITLQPYNEKYFNALMAFHLNEDDGKYTALPNLALDDALENPNKRPIVIFKNETPVGFFVLHVGEEIREYIDPKNTALIRALSIDSKYHRQGIGYEAMMLVDAYASSYLDHVHQLALAVNMNNHKAANLYFKVGYVESHRRMGVKGEQRVLVKVLKSS